jgi:hypothetical protein
VGCAYRIYNFQKTIDGETQYVISDMKVVSQKDGKCPALDKFTISANMRTQDIWFLLLISAILA